MARPFLANHWRQDSPIYLDRETGLPTVIGPFTMRWREEDELWHFDGPKGAWVPMPYPDIWSGYHQMVDAYQAWVKSEPWQKVYFIGEKAEHGARVKIGTSMNPHERLRQLQIGSPAALRILALARGDEALEREYHSKFRTQWRHGEWFVIDRRILAEIERLSV